MPVQVASDTFKIKPLVEEDNFLNEGGDGAEIWPEHPAMCRNVTFEPVPARMIDGYLTERGMLETPAIIAEAERWAARRINAALD